jgi:hypothetical protein
MIECVERSDVLVGVEAGTASDRISHVGRLESCLIWPCANARVVTPFQDPSGKVEWNCDYTFSGPLGEQWMIPRYGSANSQFRVFDV